jgi:hypothetical protein
MTSYVDFLLFCPSCGARLAGKEAICETLGHSQLWSDQKAVNAISRAGESRVARCPACSHDFWLSEGSKIDQKHPDYKSKMKSLEGGLVYSWSSWNNFGSNLLTIRGMISFVLHYDRLLRKWTNLNPEKETYLRMRLWWACNDLIRSNISAHIFKVIRGEMSAGAYIRQWLFNRKAERAFDKVADLFTENLRKLAMLNCQGEDTDALLQAEIYRQLGNFDEAKRVAKSVSSNTFHAELLDYQIKKRNSRVFLIAG